MNKSELIEALAQDINVPHREAAAITNTVIETMTEALAKGESIEIRGFGSFVIKTIRFVRRQKSENRKEDSSQTEEASFFQSRQRTARKSK